MSDQSFSPYSPVDGKAGKGGGGSEGAAKFWIKSLDEPSLVVGAQFNPKELQIDRQVPWSPPGESGKENNSKKTGGVDLEFTGAKGRSLSVELLFDEYEKDAEPGFKVTVADAVSTLEALASVRKPGESKEDERRPHHCVCSWGTALQSGTEKKFKCVIESISTKYTMFDRAGNPLRATVTLKLTEADSVSVKKDPSKKGGTKKGGK
jgi:hypothetical protein